MRVVRRPGGRRGVHHAADHLLEHGVVGSAHGARHAVVEHQPVGEVENALRAAVAEHDATARVEQHHARGQAVERLGQSRVLAVAAVQLEGAREVGHQQVAEGGVGRAPRALALVLEHHDHGDRLAFLDRHRVTHGAARGETERLHPLAVVVGPGNVGVRDHLARQAEAPDELVRIAAAPGQAPSLVILNEEIEVGRIADAHAVLEEGARHREPGHLEREAGRDASVGRRQLGHERLPARGVGGRLVDPRNEGESALLDAQRTVQSVHRTGVIIRVEEPRGATSMRKTPIRRRNGVSRSPRSDLGPIPERDGPQIVCASRCCLIPLPRKPPGSRCGLVIGCSPSSAIEHRLR